MYRIETTIEGVAPLLFNGWSETALDNLDKAITGGKLTTAQRVDEAWQKLYWRPTPGGPITVLRGEEPQRALTGVYLPRWNVKKAMMEACSMANLKEGRKSLAPYIAATVFLDGDAAFATTDVVIHACWGRRPPRTGQACLVRRPCVPIGWRLPVRLLVMDDNRQPTRLRECLEAAGVFVGLGSWRPEYGRFVVRGWEVQRAK